jgi:hypothetical protein
MSFDFSLTPRAEECRDRITEFVDEVVIPREQEAFTKGVDDELHMIASAGQREKYRRARANG